MHPFNEFDLLQRLLSDETFRIWVRQGGIRQPTAHWSRYWHQHPDQQAVMQQAQQILLASNLPDETVTPEQTEQFVQKTLRLVRPQPRPRFGRLRSRSLAYGGAVVAIVLLLITGSIWRQTNLLDSVAALVRAGTPSAKTADWQETLNTSNRPQLITLTDGSTVLLQPKARLTYPAQFSTHNREVTLVGDAFFRITKNADHPFMVLTNGMVTKVLGTSFRIQANANDPTVTVEVKTGRVAVFPQTDLERARQSPGLSNRSLLITPNQQVVFDRASGLMNRQLVDEPALLKIPGQNRDFIFTDTPISEVFETLKTAYGVDIVYDADVLEHCTLTAPLGNEPLFDKLTIICRAIGGQYEVVGAQIVLQSNGCTD